MNFVLVVARPGEDDAKVTKCVADEDLAPVQGNAAVLVELIAKAECLRLGVNQRARVVMR